MLLRVWGRAWRRNWCLGLSSETASPSVLERLGALGAIAGVQHASVSATVDDGRRRGIFDRVTRTRHFSHQVDGVLAGSFPDLLLIWIGHNDVDWRSKASECTGRQLATLADEFGRRYEIQLQRLVGGAVASGKRVAIVVFGLINFGSFFLAREDAERRKRGDRTLYPYLEADYRFFVSLRPEYREGMMEVARLFNQRMEEICRTLQPRLTTADVRVRYCDALSVASIGSADSLSGIDAWHPSPHGHLVLADNAYPVVYEQAEFLGWTQEC
jgi:lysophospholipase L1-like esterase